MCTLSFSPTTNGLLLAMNRDESLQREIASAPRFFCSQESTAIYPSEASGGTWLAANDCGLVLALLNRNPSFARAKRRSRGEIIPELIHESSLSRAHARLLAMDHDGFLPFTLVALDASNQRAIETRWDGARLQTIGHPWAPRHWFSSSLSDEEATQVRGRTCEVFRRHFSLEPENLRQLHRSHSPAPGAFSLCVHREGVATASYAEIRIHATEASFAYASGSPCERQPLMTLEFALQPSQDAYTRASGY